MILILGPTGNCNLCNLKPKFSAAVNLSDMSRSQNIDGHVTLYQRDFELKMQQ